MFSWLHRHRHFNHFRGTLHTKKGIQHNCMDFQLEVGKKGTFTVQAVENPSGTVHTFPSDGAAVSSDTTKLTISPTATPGVFTVQSIAAGQSVVTVTGTNENGTVVTTQFNFIEPPVVNPNPFTTFVATLTDVMPA